MVAKRKSTHKKAPKSRKSSKPKKGVVPPQLRKFLFKPGHKPVKKKR